MVRYSTGTITCFRSLDLPLPYSPLLATRTEKEIKERQREQNRSSGTLEDPLPLPRFSFINHKSPFSTLQQASHQTRTSTPPQWYLCALRTYRIRRKEKRKAHGNQHPSET